MRDTLNRLETQTLVIASAGGVGGMGVRRLMWQLEDSDIEIVVAPYFNDLDSNRIDVRPLAGLPLLALRQPEFTGPQRLLKRVTGALVAAVALVLLLPVMLTIAFFVRRDSPGPVLFRQTRVGRHGRHFQCLKFRTMYVDARGSGSTTCSTTATATGCCSRCRTTRASPRVGRRAAPAARSTSCRS